MRALLGFLTENCCGGEPSEMPAVAVTDVAAPALANSTSVIPLRARKRAGRLINKETTASKRNVLFLCTGNSAGSGPGRPGRTGVNDP